MTVYTVGIGGDYSDWGSAFNALVALGPLSDDFEFEQISNITNSTACSGNMQLNGHSVKFYCSYENSHKGNILNGFKTLCTTRVIIDIFKDYLTGSPYSAWKGTFEMSGLHLSGNLGVPLWRIYCGHMYAQQNGQYLKLHDLIVKNTTGIGFDISSTGWVKIDVYNVKLAGSNASPLFNFQLTSHYVGTDPAASVRSKTLNNISSYSTGSGIYFSNYWDGFATIKNCSCMGAGLLQKDFNFIAGSDAYFTVSNCACSDASLNDIAGADNLINVDPALEFQSIDSTNGAFLFLRNGNLIANPSAEPSKGFAPLRTVFQGAIDYVWPAGMQLYNGGIIPTLISEDIGKVAYGKYGDYPIGCHNAEIAY